MAIKAIVFDCFGVLYDEYSGRFNDPLVALITTLGSRYKLGVLSNASGSTLESYLKKGNMRELFDVVVASGETDFIKPQREIFEHISRPLGVKLDEILFFDDSPDHVQAATTYGIRAVRYTSLADVQNAIREVENTTVPLHRT